MTQLGRNTAFGAATRLLGARIDPFMAFNFVVEIEGLLVGGFAEVTGLQAEVETMDYREGGLNEYVHKLAGPARYPNNLVLKHGMTAIDALWSWHQEVMQGKIKRKNGSIYLLDPNGLPVMWWDFLKAYPVKWVGPEFRADGSNVAFETVELVHQGLTIPAGSRVLRKAQAARSVLNLP